jgi:hypothetical protein
MKWAEPLTVRGDSKGALCKSLNWIDGVHDFKDRQLIRPAGQSETAIESAL